MEDPLEDFLRSESERLQSLPSEERERHLEHICRLLEERVAGYMASGYEEAVAIQSAITSLEKGTSGAVTPMWSSSTLTTRCYSAVTYKVCCVLADNIIQRALMTLMVVSGYAGIHNVSTLGLWYPTNPSLVLTIIAAAVLLFSEGGLTRVFRTLTTPGSVTRAAIAWGALQQGLRVFLSLTFIWLLRRNMPEMLSGGFHVTDMSEGVVSALVIIASLMMVTPYLAGWLIGRRSSVLGLQGVRAAASTAFILTLADIAAMIVSETGGSFLMRVAYIFLSGVILAIFFGLGVFGARLGSRR